VYGKTKAYRTGLAIHCCCGLIFIGLGQRQRYDEHTWNCEESLNAAKEKLNGITN
jgi:hypothetical protein